MGTYKMIHWTHYLTMLHSLNSDGDILQIVILLQSESELESFALHAEE